MKKTYPLILPAIFFGSCNTNGPESTSPESSNSKEEKPNVLFIAVDDLRDWTGYLGEYSYVKTPNLDKLAEAGMVFTNAHCTAPVCSPSRTALLTGISPANTGVYENGNRWEGDLRQHVTLTRYFMDMGYYVAGFGKIYHGSGDLQYWHRFEYGEYSPSPKNPEHPAAFGSPLYIPDSLTGDWKRVSNAIDILEKDIHSPLFLACGIVRPHTPWDVPDRFCEMYPLDSIRLPLVKEDDQEDLPRIGKAIANRMMGDNYGDYRAQWTHQQIVDSGLWKIN
jgi:arylsulfatase A-like enzyme